MRRNASRRAAAACRAAALALVAATAAMALPGCQNRNLAGSLRGAGIGGSPDEFMVLPTAPLEMPTDFAALPVPTPGAPNRVDPQPKAEAVAGLTGRPTLATADGADLVARSGAGDPAIRARLASEDATWRAGNNGRLLERMFSRDKDALVYRDMTLSDPAEFERLRAAGIGVPPAPPALLDGDG